MQFAEQTDIAVRVLMYLELNSPNHCRVDSICDGCNVSRAQVVKVTQLLRLGKIIKSQIGRGGGFSLARPASEITIGQVVRLIEGRFHMAECFRTSKPSKCPLLGICKLRCVFDRALDGLLSTLDGYTLENITENREDLMKTCLAADAKKRRPYSAAFRME